MQVDYEKDEYHEARHAELLADEVLMDAWSSCAETFYFKGLRPGARVFEFGGAFGYNLREVAKTHPATMLELSALGRRIGQDSGIKSVSTLQELGGEQFDVVLCRHVLEHVDSPLEVLRDLRGLLAPGGGLVLVLPVEGSEDAPVQQEIDFHLYTWNPRTISNLLRRAGFIDIRFRYNHFNGRRACLPFYKHLGKEAYRNAVSLVGKLSRSRELVLECR